MEQALLGKDLAIEQLKQKANALSEDQINKF